MKLKYVESDGSAKNHVKSTNQKYEPGRQFRIIDQKLDVCRMSYFRKVGCVYTYGSCLRLPAHMESVWEPDKLTPPSAFFRNPGILPLDMKVPNEELL
jgi:hypothetical protein